MEQKEIGKFIAECRKSKKLTQAELAEKLGVTDRSVSNWENGVCLPDASLYWTLCDLLNISINELFAGKRLVDDNDKEADKNLLTMLEYHLYNASSKEITFEEFQNALKRISEFALLLKGFANKNEAVQYLMSNSGCFQEECSSAYDIYSKIFNTPILESK